MILNKTRLIGVAAVVAWFSVAILVATTYFGHSKSPYGACYAKSGRSVPCAFAKG